MNGPRRILAVLECRASDAAVLDRALAVAAESGGYLTLVAVVPTPFPTFAGPYCAPRVRCEELRACAEDVLRRAVSLVPPDVPLIAAIEEGRTRAVVARRVEAAAHDLVVVRRRRPRFRSSERGRLPAPILAVA
jgi:nucleotide-binding universal stress UspA family protein